jgi:hypothetical protein
MGPLALAALILAADPSRALLERAIEAAGGPGPLTRAAALVWDGEATIHLPDGPLKIAGTWRLEPPDRDIVETYIAGDDPKTARTMIISGARGWMQKDGHTTPLPDAVVEHERGQFYVYSLLRLVPLRDPAFALSPLPPDDEGLAGFRVTHAGWPTVDVYLDAGSRPRRLVSEVKIPGPGYVPGSGATKRQVVTLSGDIEAGGIHWPRELKITWDDRPYFDLTITSLGMMEKLEDERLAGPKAPEK